MKEGINLSIFSNSKKDKKKDHFNQKLIAPMVLGSILNPINSSIISVALIPIGQAFGVPPSQTAWLVSALYLATAIGQPVVGKLIDVFGPRILFLIATSLVGISSLIAIFAPDFWWLVVARCLLGFGTCAGYPAAMYLIRSEAERTGKDSPASILTLLSIASQTIAVVGPTLGGGLIEVGDWQSIFIVNVPLSLACVLLGYFRFPRTSEDSLREESKSSSIDFMGIMFFGITLITGLFFLMNPNWNHLYLLLIATISGAIFTAFELKIKNPFIDLRLLGGNTPLLLTYARGLLSATVSYSFLYGYTQWLETGRGLSPSHSGLLLLPMFLTSIIVSKTTGKNPAIRMKLIVGSVVQAIAMSLLLFTNHSSSLIYLGIIAILFGIPQGILNLANQNAVYFQASSKHIGASAGLLRTFMYMGAILSSATNGLFFKSEANTKGIHHLALFSLVICFILIVTLFDQSLSKIEKKQMTV
ncbi:MFS transporter [Priestia megaterium]|jgi:MFS family permease|nr:MFS transporter [Priestia megaterium]MDR4221387.1 MFS transporter [Priestia megaterium]PEX05142.1 MFS transporter [Priestia megaterium]PFT49343.1 MFS transporter [Priestia megaterium]PGH67499.1 MFS transporter [Priestia megaterium]